MNFPNLLNPSFWGAYCHGSLRQRMNVGYASKTVRSLENACHTGAPYRCDHDKALYESTFTLPYLTCQKFSKLCEFVSGISQLS